jgi:hypothetical protein
VPNPTGLSYDEIKNMPHYKHLKSAVKKAGIKEYVQLK